MSTTIYVNKAGTVRVQIDDNDRGTINTYKALGYVAERGVPDAEPEPAKAEEAAE